MFFLKSDFFKSADLGNADLLPTKTPRDSKLSILLMLYGVIYIGFFSRKIDGSVSIRGFSLIADCGLIKSTLTTSSAFFFKSTIE